MSFLPEGLTYLKPENQSAMSYQANLKECMASKRVLEAKAVLCDNQHNLIVNLGCMKGIIPRNEGAIGIDDGTTRDIALISKVNKPVCFVITDFVRDEDGNTVAMLSRKQAQLLCKQQYIETLQPGDVIPAVATHLEPFGCFVDIGCGIPSLIPIDAISISRISHPRDRFKTGQSLYAIVRSIDDQGRICLSHKELLGTWEQNAQRFSAGETVGGVIRSIESYGIFVELAPNLAGLAEYKSDVEVGQSASVYIKSLIPEKMKIKLIIVDAFDGARPNTEYEYYITEGHLDNWRYSPACCQKVIESRFFPAAE